jgi:ABC-type uncharacterized transport system substrate-binding protein
MASHIERRKFLATLGGAAVAWPVVARAQQPAMPVIGYLYFGSPEHTSRQVAAFRLGLSETGYIEGRDVAIEYRWAEGRSERLSALAGGLVRSHVAIIVTPFSLAATRAAKGASATIPIVFTTGVDPVQFGLVRSLSQPGGNVTGLTALNTELGPKQLGVLRDLLPGAARFAALFESNTPDSIIADLRAAATTLGQQIEVLRAGSVEEIDAAFASLVQKRADAVLVNASVLFFNHLAQLVTLAARYAVPAIYWTRDFTEAGGLMSYGSDVTDQLRQAGIYTGRILKGERPADLPVLRAVKFEFVINLKTAKALGLTVPDKLLAIADEVIE